MRGWEFIYRSWYKTVFQFGQSGTALTTEARIHLTYTSGRDTVQIGVDPDAELNIETVKKLYAALGQVIRQSAKDAK